MYTYSILEHRLSHSSLVMSHSPYLQTQRNKAEHKHTVESVLLIPALTVKTHYQSIVGPSYSTVSVHSPLLQHSASSGSISPPPKTASHQSMAHFPVKKGILSLSAVIESLPEDIKLTHSFLQFIEQVAKPTLAATAVSSSSSTESLSDEAEPTAEDKASQAPSPISFPVDVILTFHIRPSTVYLTCQPHSKVECIIQSPDVNFIISFSLFSHQLLEGSSCSPSGSTAGHGSGSNVVPFNNLYITGCLTTFLLQLYSPQVSSVNSPVPIIENKEALSLTVGQALVHFSRKSVLAPVAPKELGKQVTSVDDYATHNKLQVSGTILTSVHYLHLCALPIPLTFYTKKNFQ